MSAGEGAGILAIRDGKVLAFQQTKNAGKGVGIPGGKWEEGDEDLFATACRECFEETGLKVIARAKCPEFVDTCMGIKFATFLVLVEGDITYDRLHEGDITYDRLHEGEACWVEPSELISGPFGDYNVKMLKYFNVEYVTE